MSNVRRFQACPLRRVRSVLLFVLGAGLCSENVADAGPVDKVNVRKSGGSYTATFSILGQSAATAGATTEGSVAGGPACLKNEDCDDGLFCNGEEACQFIDPPSSCVPGIPPSCDDENPDTVDSCNEVFDACEHVPSACEPRIFAIVVPFGVTINIDSITQDGETAAFDPDIDGFALLNSALADAGYLDEGSVVYTLRFYPNTCNLEVKSEVELVFRTKDENGSFVELPQFMVGTTTESDLSASPLTELALAKEQIELIDVPAASQWGLLALLLCLLALARIRFTARHAA